MANFRSTNDLKINVLKRCGEVIDGTSSYDADAVMYINNVYRSIVSGGSEFDVDCGEPWIWATAATPQIVTLQLPITAGTIAVTNGSNTITFSTAPTVSVAGWYFNVQSRADWFVISSHTANSTTATIDMAYPDATASAASYTVAKLQYQLPTPMCRFVAPMITHHSAALYPNTPEQNKIYEIDLNTFIRKYPLAQMIADIPTRYAVVARDTSDNVTVQFNSYLSDNAIPTRVEVPYIPVVSDLTDSTSSIPLIPLGFRDILLHGAAYYIMLDKSDNRAETELQLAKAKLVALINHNRKELSLAGDSYGKLIPRRGTDVRRIRGWY